MENPPDLLITSQKHLDEARQRLWLELGVIWLLWVVGAIGAFIYVHLHGQSWPLWLVLAGLLVVLFTDHRVRVAIRLSQIASRRIDTALRVPQTLAWGVENLWWDIIDEKDEKGAANFASPERKLDSESADTPG